MVCGFDSPWPSLSGGLRACGCELFRAIEDYILDAPEEEYQKLLGNERLLAALEAWNLHKNRGPTSSWSDGYKDLARFLNSLCQEMYEAATPHIKSEDFRRASRMWFEEREGWFPPQPISYQSEPIKWPSWLTWAAFKNLLKSIFSRKN